MSPQPPSIYIVEDEALIAMELQHRLVSLGYTVCGVSARGEQALPLIAAAQPDLVLMDVGLAGEWSGVETARRLRETASIPVIFLTAYSDEELLQQAVSTEPFGYLLKPYQERELHAAIQMALFKHRAERELKELNDRLDEKVRLRTAELEAAVAALQVSEAFNRSLIQHLPLKLFLKDLDSVYVMVNESYAGDLHLAPADFVGRDDFDFHPRELAEKYRADDREVLASGQVKDIEESYVVDGHRHWVHTIKSPVHDASGRLVGLLGAFRDITARKLMQEALAESEARYRALFRESVDGLALADARTGTLLDCNDAFCSLVGWERSELIGRPQRMLHPPEDARGDVSLTFEQHRSEEVGQVLETRILTKAGEIREVEIKGAPLQVDGQSILLGVFRDISGRKSMEQALRSSERHFRTMAEVSPAIIYRLSPEGLVEYASPAVVPMFGFQPEEVLGRHFVDFIQPEDHALAVAAFQAIMGSEHVPSFDLRLRRADGSSWWGNVNIAAIFDEGRLVGFQGVLFDLTERKRAEAALAASEARLNFVVSSSPAVIYTCRAGGDYGATYISPNVITQMGYAPEEFLNDSGFWLNRIHPDDVERVLTGLPELFREGRHVHEYRFRQKDGVWRWMRDELRLVRNAAGEPIEIIGSWLDITHRKHAEEQSRRQAELQRVVAGISAGLVHLPAGELDSAISQALEKIGAFLGADRSYIFQFSEDLSSLSNTHEWCAPGIETQIHTLQAIPVAPGDWFAAQLRHRQPVLITDVEDMPPEAAALQRDLQRQGVQSVLSLPIEWRQHLIGFIGFDSVRGRRAWPDDIMAMLDVVANALGGAIVQERAERALNLLNQELEQRVTERTAEVLSHQSIFAALSHSSPVGIFQTDVQGQGIYFNRRLCEISGLPDDRTAGERWLEAIHPDDRARVARTWAESLPAEAPFSVEFRYLHPGGKVVWVIAQIVPFQGVGGEVAGYIGTVTDISERKQAEEDVLRSREQYLNLVENVHDGIMRDDLDGRIIFANRRFLEWFGREGRDISQCLLEDNIAPEWRPVIREWHNRRVRGEKVPDHYECVCVRADGQRMWVDVYVTPVVENGRIVGTQSAVRDITERKRVDAERERLMTAIQQSGEAIMITGLDGSIEYVNPAFTQITGYSSQEVAGRNPRLLKSGKYDQAFYDSFWQTLLAGDTFKGRMVNRRKDGVLVTLDITVSPVRDASGNIVNFVEVMRDITDELELQQQLHQAQKMESIGRLAGGVAHDFNNLLSIINGYSEILLSKLDPRDPMHDAVTEIGKAGDRAAGLTQQLLAFSRKQVIQPQVLDLNLVVGDVEKILRRVLGEDINLTTVLSPGLGAVKADPGQLTQVLMNLAVNARDAMPAGGRLLIETTNVEFAGSYAREHYGVEPGPYVQLTVSDTGVGIDEATRSRIFEPFFTTKASGLGTGLGLATVYGIVQQCGGYIHVYSEPGHGATFKIYLPRVDAATAPLDASPVPETLTGKETILVVEDQQELRRLVGTVLRDYGYRVLEASNAGEALLHTERHAAPIDLLLTDVIMPGMSGRDLAERLAPLRPEMKVLYMSGYTENMIAPRGILTAGTEFLQKPFGPESLAAKVRQVLGSPRPVKHILVVDDEDGVRSLLRQFLQGAGYEVCEAQNGKQAAALAASAHFDLVITDLVMPEQEGLEIIRLLRKTHPGLAVIAISGAFHGEFLKVAQMLGAQATLQKPVNSARLLETVRRVLSPK